MKKNYVQITKIYANAAFISALLLIAGGIILLFEHIAAMGAAQIILGAIILAVLFFAYRTRKDSVSRYLSVVAKNTNAVSSNLMGSFPIPVAVTHIDGSIQWYNDKFSTMFLTQKSKP